MIFGNKIYSTHLLNVTWLCFTSVFISFSSGKSNCVSYRWSFYYQVPEHITSANLKKPENLYNKYGENLPKHERKRGLNILKSEEKKIPSTVHIKETVLHHKRPIQISIFVKARPIASVSTGIKKKRECEEDKRRTNTYMLTKPQWKTKKQEGIICEKLFFIIKSVLNGKEKFYGSTKAMNLFPLKTKMPTIRKYLQEQRFVSCLNVENGSETGLAGRWETVPSIWLRENRGAGGGGKISGSRHSLTGRSAVTVAMLTSQRRKRRSFHFTCYFPEASARKERNTSISIPQMGPNAPRVLSRPKRSPKSSTENRKRKRLKSKKQSVHPFKIVRKNIISDDSGKIIFPYQVVLKSKDEANDELYVIGKPKTSSKSFKEIYFILPPKGIFSNQKENGKDGTTLKEEKWEKSERKNLKREDNGTKWREVSSFELIVPKLFENRMTKVKPFNLDDFKIGWTRDSELEKSTSSISNDMLWWITLDDKVSKVLDGENVKESSTGIVRGDQSVEDVKESDESAEGTDEGKLGKFIVKVNPKEKTNGGEGRKEDWGGVEGVMRMGSRAKEIEEKKRLMGQPKVVGGSSEDVEEMKSRTDPAGPTGRTSQQDSRDTTPAEKQDTEKQEENVEEVSMPEEEEGKKEQATVKDIDTWKKTRGPFIVGSTDTGSKFEPEDLQTSTSKWVKIKQTTRRLLLTKGKKEPSIFTVLYYGLGLLAVGGVIALLVKLGIWAQHHIYLEKS